VQATDGKTIDVVICIHEQSPLQPSLLRHRELQVDQFGPALRMGYLQKFPGNKLSQSSFCTRITVRNHVQCGHIVKLMLR
jgi:hypothetical protein